MPRRNKRKHHQRPLPFSLTGGIVVRLYPPAECEDIRPGVVVAEAVWIPPLGGEKNHA